ncbi:MAG TPA: serine hydrolase [Candidatus Obscuribacterales bacterium]
MNSLLRKLVLVFLMTAGMALNAHMKAGAQEAPLAGLDAYVEKVMKEVGVPGMAIAVVKDDGIVLKKGYGIRKLGALETVNENTIFSIGSTTKAFTAALAGILVDEGKMQWDGRVADYLKGFELYDPYVTREVTMRDLLSHRTGLPQTDLMWHASPFTRKDILYRIRFQKPSHGFRAKYDYQNVMYLAAGEAEAAVSGKKWDDLLAERILVPLNMKSSTSRLEDLKEQDNVASPHSLIDEKLTVIKPRNIDNIGPAGSILSNVSDMSQWIRLLLDEGKLGDRQLISGGSVRELMSPVIHMSAPELINKIDADYCQDYEYALGWVAQIVHGHKVLWHTGGIDGMRSFVGLLPEKKAGFVILSNTDAFDQCHTIGLGYRLFDILLGLPERDWAGILLKERKSQMQSASQQGNQSFQGRAAKTHPSLAMDQYCGKFRHPVYGDIDVSLAGGHLVLNFGSQRIADLAHWHFDTFQTAWRDPFLDKVLVTFYVDSEGFANKLEFQNAGLFERVK